MSTQPHQKSEPAWHLIDAEGKVLGRFATKTADLLRGKRKASFVPYLDCGDHVVVINAGKLVLTGNKMETKAYHHYSGYPGGMKAKYAKELIETKPEAIVRNAVKGMLPKTKLQNEWLKRLHIYADANHPHLANVAHLESK